MKRITDTAYVNHDELEENAIMCNQVTYVEHEQFGILRGVTRKIIETTVIVEQGKFPSKFTSLHHGVTL